MSRVSAYFDYRSSTPLLREVREVMEPYWMERFSLPSALHSQGLKARDALDKSRNQFVKFLNAASEDEIIFTSSATESANLAIKGVAWAAKTMGNHIVASEIEHPSVLRSLEFLAQQGFCFTLVPVDKQGFVSPEHVAKAIRKETVLLCLHHANHDIGTIQPIKDLVQVAWDHGIPTFLDASTTGGWINIDIGDLGVDLLSICPHHFYGPKGVGVLYRNRRARLQPLIHGGMQEHNIRAGAENLPAIVGAGLAAEIGQRNLEERRSQTGKKQDRLWSTLCKSIENIGLNGAEIGPKRLSTNLNFSVEFVEGEGLVLMSDVRGIALGSGSSCVSNSVKSSPVLEAIGLPRSLAQSNIILSLGFSNTDEEVDYFLETFPKLVEKMRLMSPTWDEFKAGGRESEL